MYSLNKDYLEKSFTPKGIGTWRKTYIDILNEPAFGGYESILELGAGTPDFLRQCRFKERVAIDLNEKYKKDFEKNDIKFICADLDKTDLSGYGKFDVVVCSDVFEHLLFPFNLLENIKTIVSERGVLFSHVPNEFTLLKTLSVMFGRSESLYFHKDEEEWSDPHVRRFTLIGYKKLLGQFFSHNIYISHLVDGKFVRAVSRIGIEVPYCLQKGPTFISTNSSEVAKQVKKAIS